MRSTHSFNLLLEQPKFNFESIDTPTGRFYKSPVGYLPSVTTKLGAYFKKDLRAWRDRVGAAEADKISSQGRNRGTALHKIVEDYILGKDWKTGRMPIFLESFRSIKPILDEHVTDIYGLEYPLWSKTLLTAGRTDLVARYKGRPTVIDFKTARKRKKEEWIKDYLVQATAYAFMSNSLIEQLKYGIEHICIIIAVDGERPQIFEQRVTNEMWREVVDIMRNTKVELPKELNEIKSLR